MRTSVIAVLLGAALSFTSAATLPNLISPKDSSSSSSSLSLLSELGALKGDKTGGGSSSSSSLSELSALKGGNIGGGSSSSSSSSLLSEFEGLKGSDLGGLGSGLEKRTICLKFWGITIGWCYGSWSQGNWNSYNSQCESRGWSPNYKSSGGSVYFQWSGEWILDTEWSYIGVYWLPTLTVDWGFEGPAVWEPRPQYPVSCYNAYQAACSYRGQDPHYYWDSGRNGYWYEFNESFYFETDFIFIQNDAYWVPSQFAW